MIQTTFDEEKKLSTNLALLSGLVDKITTELTSNEYRKATRTSNVLIQAVIHIKEVCLYRREDEHT